MGKNRDDELFDDIDRAIGKQYRKDYNEEYEFVDYEEEIKREEREERRRNKAQNKNDGRKKKKKKSGCLTRLIVFLFILAGIGVFMVYTKPGNKLLLKAGSIYARHKMKTDSDAEPFKEPKEIPAGWVYDKDVINILLVGIETFEGGNRTDSMILLSENTKTGKITLVSFLRDTYVEISGLGVKRKLNYAYAHGKNMSTLINTIQDTFKIYINAYAYVDFERFEKIIDTLGGVDIEITEKEAEYLNTTNYISNPKYRNLKAGVNHFNGNQALGYCRVRKIPTLEGVNNDLGRSLRQRKVLSAVFEKYKNQKITKLVSTTNKILESMTTNMTSGNIYTLLEAYTEHRTDKIEQLMIPDSKLFEPVTISGVGAVLSIDKYLQQNIDLLHQTLYGNPATK